MTSDLVVMAGPCADESEDQLRRIAEAAKKVGAKYLRGGAFKPRTKAGEWMGFGEKALGWMRKVGDEFDLKIVTEILDASQIPMFKGYGVDLFQVGARNAQNQSLLLALGEAGVPVLLKNGMNTTLKEWMGSAGKAGDKRNVMLCARGKNNETDVARNGQDIVTLVELVNKAPYTVIFDPSHVAGKRELVYGTTMGAVATGVDGIIVEVHHDPIVARTDGRQSITPKQLEYLVKAAHGQRKAYLAQKQLKEGFASANIPGHVDIYFKAKDLETVSKFVEGLTPKTYDTGRHISEESGILTARIPAGPLGRLKHEVAVGKITKYSPEAGAASSEGVVITMPDKSQIKLSPFSREAMNFRGKEPSGFSGLRVELAHGYAGQVVKDAFLTIEMGRVPGLNGKPLVLYNRVTE